jgi:hypothetical protein
MASTIQVDKIQDTGGNTILSSNSTGTFTYEAASGANFTALDADNVSAGTLAIARGGTGAATLAAAGLTNTPAFIAESSHSSNQAMTDATWTKISYNYEVYDSGTVFDPSTNYRFTVPSGEGGKYQFNWSIFVSGSGDAGNMKKTTLYKNGSILPMADGNAYVDANSTGSPVGWNRSSPASHTDYDQMTASCMVTLAAADYIEVYAYYDVQSGAAYFRNGSFSGHKVIT